MHSSFHAFMRGLIDYAGLFPPAKLDLDPAIRNYAHYREGEEAFLLGRFICPAKRLGDLAPYHDELFSRGAPYEVSMLAAPAADAAAYPGSLEADGLVADAFVRRHRGRVRIPVVESRLPEDALETFDASDLSALLDNAVGRLESVLPEPVAVFFEASLPESWRDRTPRVVEAVALHNRRRGDGPPAGYKLRCGGLEPSAFPPVERVALSLASCRDQRVPFKATAGLHHPLRHRSATIDTDEHGFLNVFGAGVLAREHGLDVSAISEILEEREPSAFRFDEDTMHWRDLAADTEAIEEARRNAVISFGSCSIDEPYEDLAKLGLR